MTDSELEARQRAYETGIRYGRVDARAGLTEPSSNPHSIVGEACADIWRRGWDEGHKVTMAPLLSPGRRVSVPSLVPGERMAATVTGQTKVLKGIVCVECRTPGGTAPLWIPVPMVQAK
jgi:hypothetical protein